MTKNFIVKSLEVEGFRGFNPPFSCSFDRPLVFLFGKGGRGKSSTLRAIEWCLFGDIAYFRFLESPHTRDELVNSHHPDRIAKVRLVLRRGKHEFVFLREKEFGSRKTKFTVIEPHGEFHDNEAEKRRLALLGLTFTDFYRAVYLHQESVRGLLTDDPSERDEAMDRLLGLETLRNVVDSIPLRDVKEGVRDLQNKKKSVEEGIRGRVQQIEQDRRKSIEKAKRAGVTKKDITLKSACTIMGLIDHSLQKIGGEYKLEPPKIGKPTSIEDLAKGSRKAKNFLGKCRRSIIEISRLDILTRNRTKLGGLRESFASNAEEIKRISDRLTKIKRRYGTRATIRSSIRKVEEKSKELERKRGQVDSKSRLIGDAVEYLEKTAERICPVCGSEIKNVRRVLRNLRSQISKYQRRTIREIDRQMKALQDQKRLLESALQELEDLENKLSNLTKTRNQLIKETSRIAAKTLSERDARAFLSKEIRKLNAEIAKLQVAYKAKERALQRIERSIEKIKAIYDVLTKEEEFEQLESILSAKAKEMKTLRSKIRELDEFKKQLTEIIEAVTTTQMQLASKMIAKASPKIKRFYKALGKHPYYGELKITVQPKRGRYKNSYQIKAFHPTEGTETLVSTRFSASQMNCTALAIFLAMSRSLSHKLGFLILDDPSQNLDITQKKALVKALNTTLHYNQLFVSTQDTEFQRFLSQLMPKRKRIIYNFTGWDKRGPRIKIIK